MDKIILIYGGKSAEHDISVLSAFSMLGYLLERFKTVKLVMIRKDGTWFEGPEISEPVLSKEELILTANEEGKALKGKIIKPGDIYEEDTVIFPILHGPNGEDGTIQGLFEVLNMPYVGAGVLASACAMDKLMTKVILEHEQIPQLPYVGLNKHMWKTKKAEVLERVKAKLSYPMYIKPANMGSSVGVSKVESDEDFIKGIEEALKYDRRVVVEQGVDAREIEVAVLGNDDVETTIPGEVVKTVDFYDFDAKYINNDVTLQIPAQISDEITTKIRNYAKEAYMALNCTGLSRCDFFLTKDGSIYLNEINTMPGFTPYSLYPLMWQEMGISYGDLLQTLIDLAKKNYQEKNKLK